MPGGGWVITSLRKTTVRLADDAPFEVNRAVIAHGNQRQVVYYWFEQRGRRMASEYAMKWYLLVDALLRDRTDGALVRVTTTADGVNGLEGADARMQRFLQLAVPKLEHFVPH